VQMLVLQCCNLSGLNFVMECSGMVIPAEARFGLVKMKLMQACCNFIEQNFVARHFILEVLKV
jgi:hypothetical protein